MQSNNSSPASAAKTIKIRSFIKGEFVLFASLLCAIVSSFFCPPSVDYLGYIDWNVLSLLMCLMLTVEGFTSIGFFTIIANKVTKSIHHFTILVLMLVLLPFIVAMLVTNDVALIAFVPFAITILVKMDRKALIIPVVVLQTISANLGSMATPIGNPQNLFVFTKYELSIGQFASVVLPFIPLGVALLVIVTSLIVLYNNRTRKEKAIVASNSLPQLQTQSPVQSTADDAALSKMPISRVIVYTLLFVLCILSVVRVVDYFITWAIVLIAFFIVDRKLIIRIDWCLLLTFICFFIFSGNIGNIEVIKSFVVSLMQKNVFFCSLGLSQVISNVPAAILLSGFTDNWRDLILGADIGGLGTPIASLASLISLKIYMKMKDSRPGRYILCFLALNALFLIVFIAIAVLHG
ncbi:MAG: SLC13 family permease [Saccharofermentanaceae bacterium]|jgi:Na+/H+ antiporter NhaD/arsenite permease-like protein|nr:anion permease [Clostridia bacterium]NLX68632.1 citrate transporter [Clostridiaceae bacterium]HOO49430.1 SLC13 family permease [Saccharofermentans sp.]HPE27265.1 SLC13 family permease [Saccharofermentans sp.]HPJ80916.1 SLC13 family permease [Saccharofermentans sp.]